MKSYSILRILNFELLLKSTNAQQVFAKAGLDIETSTMCYYQRQFGLDIQLSALVHNLSNIHIPALVSADVILPVSSSKLLPIAIGI